MTGNSIEGARKERDEAVGYDELVAEVEAIEAAVDGSTPFAVREEVVKLRNQIERPPLKQDGNNSINSAEHQKAGVDAVRAIAQALAAEV